MNTVSGGFNWIGGTQDGISGGGTQDWISGGSQDGATNQSGGFGRTKAIEPSGH